jgi:hypothetical protein
MPAELTRRLLLDPIQDFQAALDKILGELGPDAHVAVLPQASSTIIDMIK